MITLPQALGPQNPVGQRLSPGNRSACGPRGGGCTPAELAESAWSCPPGVPTHWATNSTGKLYEMPGLGAQRAEAKHGYLVGTGGGGGPFLPAFCSSGDTTEQHTTYCLPPAEHWSEPTDSPNPATLWSAVCCSFIRGQCFLTRQTQFRSKFLDRETTLHRDT